MDFNIYEYSKDEELEWLDIHASVMVDSYAWWIVIHKKPSYKNRVIDLVAKVETKLLGLLQ